MSWGPDYAHVCDSFPSDKDRITVSVCLSYLELVYLDHGPPSRQGDVSLSLSLVFVFYPPSRSISQLLFRNILVSNELNFSMADSVVWPEFGSR